MHNMHEQKHPYSQQMCTPNIYKHMHSLNAQKLHICTSYTQKHTWPLVPLLHTSAYLTSKTSCHAVSHIPSYQAGHSNLGYPDFSIGDQSIHDANGNGYSHETGEATQAVCDDCFRPILNTNMQTTHDDSDVKLTFDTILGKSICR